MALTVFAPSPFHHPEPIQDREGFFNRDDEVRKVLSRLRRGQSVSVVGKEKIGKTSFLRHLSHPQVATRHGFKPDAHLFFYVDCKRLADLSEDDCLRQIKTIVGKTVSKWETRSVPALESMVSSDTYHWLEQAISLLKEEDVQSVIQLDDFDQLAANGRLSLRFFEGLRALGDVHDTMAYLTMSRVPLVELQGRLPAVAGSPFFNIFRKFELQPFDPGETRRFLVARLVSVGAAFPEIILEFIYDLSGGEPHRLQLAGACAYDVWCQNAGSLCEEHCGEIEKRFNDAL